VEPNLHLHLRLLWCAEQQLYQPEAPSSIGRLLALPQSASPLSAACPVGGPPDHTEIAVGTLFDETGFANTVPYL